MALSKGMTALRAALGAVGGGLEGYAQFQELERRRRKEEEAAQMQQDAFTLSMIQAQGGTLGAPITSSAMPAQPPGGTTLQRAVATGEAATAPPPAQTVKIRGMEFPVVTAQDKLRMADDQFERSIAGLTDEQKQMARMARVGIPASAMMSREPRQPRRELIKETGQIVDIDTGEITTPKGYLVPRKATGAGGAKGPSAEDLLRAEAQWNSLTNIPDAQLKPEEVQFRNTMVRTFDKLRASPSGKGAPALNLIFQAVAAAEAQNKRLTAPPKAEGGDADADLAEARRRQAGQQGGVAPAPLQRPAAAPTTAPAAPKPPAEPTSMADAAAKQASRAELWDKLKSQNPKLSDDEITARVMREIP